jgi:hypothetical protein
MKNKIINREVKDKVDSFWKSYKRVLKDKSINKEIERCSELYYDNKILFKSKKEEEYVKMMVNLRDNILDYMVEGESW